VRSALAVALRVQEYFIRSTPLLNILHVAFRKLPSPDPTVPRCINELLGRGGRLTDTTFITLSFAGHGFVLSESKIPSRIFDHHWDGRREVIIRASLSFLAKIYLNAVARPHIHTAAEEIDDLAEKVLSVPASATIFALKAQNRQFGSQHQYRIPGNRTNVENLADNITTSGEGGLYLSPGFLELLDDVTGRSHPITYARLVEDLVAEGLLFRRQDIKEEDIYGAREGHIALDDVQWE